MYCSVGLTWRMLFRCVCIVCFSVRNVNSDCCGCLLATGTDGLLSHDFGPCAVFGCNADDRWFASRFYWLNFYDDPRPYIVSKWIFGSSSIVE